MTLRESGLILSLLLMKKLHNVKKYSPLKQVNNKLYQYLFHSWKFHNQKAAKIGIEFLEITVRI